MRIRSDKQVESEHEGLAERAGERLETPVKVAVSVQVLVLETRSYQSDHPHARSQWLPQVGISDSDLVAEDAVRLPNTVKIQMPSHSSFTCHAGTRSDSLVARTS